MPYKRNDREVANFDDKLIENKSRTNKTKIYFPFQLKQFKVVDRDLNELIDKITISLIVN